MTAALFDPAMETLPATELRQIEDAAFARQVQYLFARSPLFAERLAAAGFRPDRPPRLADLPAIPLTGKQDIRQSQEEAPPLGRHMACDWPQVIRLYSSSGTTGRPCYMGLTRQDLQGWLNMAGRSFRAAGIGPGVRVVTTAGAGPFIAGTNMEVFTHIGATVIPLGPGLTDRVVQACQLAHATYLGCTPSYALHLADWCQERGLERRSLGLRHLCVAGEPGGGVPAVRNRIQDLFGARVTETMGLADVGPAVWGECLEQGGMHFCGQGLVHTELIDPDTGMPQPWEPGVEGEPVYTALDRECVPLLRFRSRDQVRVMAAEPCRCGRTSVRIRCVGRTDDMFIVRGVKVFPSAVQDVVASLAPRTSGHIRIRLPRTEATVKPPVPLLVEEGPEPGDRDALRAELESLCRDRLVFRAQVELAPPGSLERSQYKGRLIQREG